MNVENLHLVYVDGLSYNDTRCVCVVEAYALLNFSKT